MGRFLAVFGPGRALAVYLEYLLELCQQQRGQVAGGALYERWRKQSEKEDNYQRNSGIKVYASIVLYCMVVYITSTLIAIQVTALLIASDLGSPAVNSKSVLSKVLDFILQQLIDIVYKH